MRKSDQNAGYAWLELVAVLAVIALLMALALPATTGPQRAWSTQALSNMRKLQQATQQMVMDERGAWPGDGDGSLVQWSSKLVPEYLSTNDLCRLMSVNGRLLPMGRLPTKNTNGVVVYAVKKDSLTNVVFLSTANINNTASGPIFDARLGLFKNKEFAILHKGGDGAILLPKQITNAAIVGTFVPLCQ